MSSEASVVLQRLLKHVRDAVPSLVFEILEIGAVPLLEQPEPFHRLLDDFPGSRIHAFELDPASCETLRQRTRPGIEVHPVGIGRRAERRTLYLTRAAMCSSLYPPNEQLLERFRNMDVAFLRDTAEVDTVSIDDFIAGVGIERVDFVKIDIQGAELDAFQGGQKTLASSLAIVTEVEFFEHYKQQPLFADVDEELRAQGFMFHKFLTLEGSSLKPLVINNRHHTATWHLWADAMYVRSMEGWPSLPPDATLRLGVLAYLYGSPDITYQCLNIYDQAIGTSLTRSVFST